MIFAKTNLGRAAAFDPQSTLSRPEKALLRLIDGKTRLTTISSSLPPAGCSLALIEALLDQELIQLAKTDAGTKAGSANDDHADGDMAPDRNRYLAQASSHDGNTVPMGLMPQSASPSMPELLPQLLPQFAPRLALDGLPAAKHSAHYEERLESAKDSLATFVLTYLPQDAAVVLQQVDQIAHNDQLKATIITVLSMANQASRPDPRQTRALNQTLLQLADE